MGKNGKRENKQKSAPTQLPQGFSVEEWSHIIAKAIEEAEQNRRMEASKQREENLKIWQKTIGFRDYSNVHDPRRWILEFFNVLRVFGERSFVPRSKVRGDRVTFSLLQMIPSMVFGIVGGLLLVASIGFVIISLILALAGEIIVWWQVIYIVLFGILYSLYRDFSALQALNWKTLKIEAIFWVYVLA